MSDITLPMQINSIAFLRDRYKDCESNESVEIMEAVLATLEEAQKRECKCRWKNSNHSGCGITNNFFIDDVDFDYCPYCAKKIEWLEEEK